MKEIIVKRDDGLDLKFRGELLAIAASSSERQDSNYSGNVARWIELYLYKTEAGKYVCQRIGRTRMQGERDIFTATVCATEQEVIEFFGTGWLSKELYKEAKITAVEVIQ